MDFKVLFEKSPICYALVEKNKKTLFVNSALSSYTGYSKQELMELNFIDITHPKDCNIEFNLFEQLVKGDINEYRIEKRFIHKSGKVIWGDLFVTIFSYEKFAPGNSILSTIVDITKKKENEFLLKKEEANFKDMFMHVPEAMGIYSVETNAILDVNNAALLISGYDREELLSMDASRFLQQKEKVNFQSLVDENKPSSSDRQVWELTKKDGKIRLVRSISYPVEYKGIKARQAIIVDVTERENAINKIKENEALINVSEKIAGMGSWEWDILNDATRWSKNMYRLLKVNPNETIPSFDFFMSRVHLDDHSIINKAYEQLVHNKKKIEIVHRILFPNDQVMWVRNIIMPYFEKDQLVRLRGVNIDITKKKEYEDELLLKDQALKSSLNAIGIADLDLNIELVNDALLELWGYSRQEILGKSMMEFWVGDGIFKTISELQEKGFSFGEDIGRKKDGTFINIQYSAIVLNNSEGNPVKVFGSFLDITERKKREVESMKLSMVVEQGTSSVIIFDLQRNIEYVNPEFTKLTGYEMHEVIGKNENILWANKTDKGLYGDLWAIVDEGNIWKGELINKTKSGEFIWIRKTVSSVVDENGNIINYVSTGIDITSKKEIENELIVAKEKAEESDRLKTAFLQNISHEIRTPMNGILGFMELLQEPDLESETRAEFINIVNQSGQRLMNTVNDIIEISKIESGFNEMKIAEVNVEKIMQYNFDFFQPQVFDKGLDLILSENHITGQNAIIQTDQTKLDAILSNLINNALKFTRQGSIEIGNYLEENNIVFYVKDTGIGIHSDRLKSIFERFVQADDHITRAHEGAGLGLTIVDAYVRAMQGEIWVDSVVGKGSSFFFSIPYLPMKNASIQKLENHTFTKNANILLVEDDKINFEYCKILLENAGFNVVHAQDGEIAVTKMHKNSSISLVLMDLKMPNMGGLEATREIRKFNKTVPIIAQTAFGFIKEKDNALAAGCSDYISKPIDSKKLIGMIKKYLN